MCLYSGDLDAEVDDYYEDDNANVLEGYSFNTVARGWYVLTIFFSTGTEVYGDMHPDKRRGLEYAGQQIRVSFSPA